MSTENRRISAEEYAQPPDLGVPYELVRGELVEMRIPKPRDGQVCSEVSRLIANFAKEHDLGHVARNDAGIVTERDPDTVRGGDVWFISRQKIPKGPLTQDYREIPPDVVIEVKSAFDRWNEILAKVAEHLNCGVAVACVLDPESETVRLYCADKPEVVLVGEEQVSFPEQLPGFSTAAKAFFE